MNYQEKYVGMTRQHKNGLRMTIIAYQDSTHITVQFEDGVIVESYLEAWRKNSVKHPHYNPMKPSLPECKVLYYLKPLGFQKYAKGYWKKFHPEFGKMEFDAFNEQYKYAVEYDGCWAHNKPDVLQRDAKKEELCRQVGIKLIKIREAGLPMHNHSHSIIYRRPGDNLELGAIIRDIIQQFNTDTAQHYSADIDIRRDEQNILNLYASLSYKRSDRVGEKSIAHCGMEMTIIEYFHHKNITIQFADGTIRNNITYQQFQQGCVAPEKHSLASIKNTTQYLGQSKQNNAGDVMTVLAYRNSNDIDIQFDDGTVVSHRSVADFNQGSILNPNSNISRDSRLRQQAPIRLGEIHHNKLNEPMTIIAYRNSQDVDVQFDDGSVRQHVTYLAVQRGQVRKQGHVMPGDDSRVGEKHHNQQGLVMTIIEYFTSRDVTIQFEDGTICQHLRYGNVCRGHVKHPNTLNARINQDRIGEVHYTKTGEWMKIVDYCDSKHVTVQFQDGATKANLHYTHILSGSVQRPINSKRIGETHYNNRNERFVIIEYYDNKHITVQFDDGAIRRNVQYSNIMRGRCTKPTDI